MKVKLFLAASLFTIFANAQVSTINENFNDFTAGNTTFPQKGWSAVIAANPLPFPPAPMMIVAVDGANKFVQAYSGNNVTLPSYLITPQIVAPAGDKTISFDTGLVPSSPGVATIQIGVATSTTDMTTFVAVGNPIQITTTTIENVKVDIPASAGSYLVIRVTPTAAHTALQIDNVKYDTNLAVNESAFNTNNVKLAVSQDNNSLVFSSQVALTNAKVYNAAGQIATEGKIINNTFDITKLKTGVYFIVIENKEGQPVKSKFIKK